MYYSSFKDLSFKIALIIIYTAFTIIRINFGRLSRKTNKEVERRINQIDQILLGIFITYEVITFILIIAYPSSTDWATFEMPLWLSIIGVIIGVMSLFLFVWVHLSLGKFFTYKIQIVKNQELIRKGPYKYVRHPMYSAFILLHISVILITYNWFIASTWSFGLFVVLIFRIKKEEELLLEKFGERYSAYMKETGRFLPRIF
jgi:protein-S-isoprenylcysteine O-methyltransferase Ste14